MERNVCGNHLSITLKDFYFYKLFIVKVLPKGDLEYCYCGNIAKYGVYWNNDSVRGILFSGELTFLEVGF